jgi:hypothetical protein
MYALISSWRGTFRVSIVVAVFPPRQVFRPARNLLLLVNQIYPLTDTQRHASTSPSEVVPGGYSFHYYGYPRSRGFFCAVGGMSGNTNGFRKISRADERRLSRLCIDAGSFPRPVVSGGGSPGDSFALAGFQEGNGLASPTAELSRSVAMALPLR